MQVAAVTTLRTGEWTSQASFGAMENRSFEKALALNDEAHRILNNTEYI